MPAYVVGLHKITDPEKFQQYKAKIESMVTKYGGRYLTRGNNLTMPEGGHWAPERVVIIEFPNMASINAWYTSSEYQPLIALRKACQSDQDMTFFMEGL